MKLEPHVPFRITFNPKQMCNFNCTVSINVLFEFKAFVYGNELSRNIILKYVYFKVIDNHNIITKVMISNQ